MAFLNVSKNQYVHKFNIIKFTDHRTYIYIPFIHICVDRVYTHNIIHRYMCIIFIYPLLLNTDGGIISNKK